MFPRTMHEYGHLLADDAVVCVKGRLDMREDPPKIICIELKRPELVLDGTATPIKIKLPLDTLTEQKVAEFKALLLRHPGDSPVLVWLKDKWYRLPDDVAVDTRNGLFAELRVLLGADCLMA